MNINCRSFWHRPIICFAATSIWCVCALLHAQLISTPHAFTKRPLLLFNAKCSSMSVSRQGEQPSLQAHLTSHIQLDVLLLLSIVFFFFFVSVSHVGNQHALVPIHNSKTMIWFAHTSQRHSSMNWAKIKKKKKIESKIMSIERAEKKNSTVENDTRKKNYNNRQTDTYLACRYEHICGNGLYTAVKAAKKK